MQQIVKIAPIFTIFVLLSLILNSCNLLSKKPDLKKAQHAEINGNIEEALEVYTETLLLVTNSITLPDYNRSKFLKPSLWLKEVERYQIWINSSELKSSEIFVKALDGVLNCINRSTMDNRLLHFDTIALESQSFNANWEKTFFASNVKIDSAHNSIRNESFSRGNSFFRVSSPKNYTYTIHLLCPDQKRQVVAKLYPESNVTFMVIPGEYLFICKSSVTFESGQSWISPFTVIKLTIPDKSSLITADLLTSISR